MTVRFRPVEANELVDDERAQRLYMGSAITMEQGKLARSLAPCRCSCLQHAPAAPPTSAATRRLLSSFLQPSGCRSRIYCLHLPVVDCQLAITMLETALFAFSIG